jgi:hypothetical protein
MACAEISQTPIPFTIYMNIEAHASSPSHSKQIQTVGCAPLALTPRELQQRLCQVVRSE